jgi:hypothetical protein
LESSQIKFANFQAVVISVGFYHGGDALYSLQHVPGLWHEPCLEPLPLPRILGVCGCVCHQAGTLVVHPVPCCTPCVRCGLRIATGMGDAHVSTCADFETETT